jgi:peptidyl-prolyl cis-trans isomerase B (cyclophilin B)
MIQGGDPEGTGMGGSDKNLKGEFAINNWKKNTLSHKRGVISMARQGHPLESYYGEQIPFEQREPYYNSATSQFFIVHQDSPHLDGQYAAFGEVIYGIEVVDAIAKVSVNISDKPKTDIVMNRVYVVTYEEAQAIINGN